MNIDSLLCRKGVGHTKYSTGWVYYGEVCVLHCRCLPPHTRTLVYVLRTTVSMYYVYVLCKVCTYTFPNSMYLVTCTQNNKTSHVVHAIITCRRTTHLRYTRVHYITGFYPERSVMKSYSYKVCICMRYAYFP